MSKINILTIHFGENHGSFLQTFALQTYLESIGHSVEIIDYIPKRYRIWNNLYRRKHVQFSLPIILAYYPIAVLRESPLRRKFRKFAIKHLHLTKKCTNHEDLKKVSTEGDVYIVGSDQVWNEDYNGLHEMAYYFDFLPENKRRISYAASFGKESAFESEYAEEVIPLLKKFDAISVREYSGILKLAECNLSATHVVDPTFLLSPQQWSQFAKDPDNVEPYVLVYVIDSAFEKLLQIANEIKIRYGVKLYVICYQKINDSRVDKCFTTIMPDEFVGLVKNATFVVANSFHGTAFSLIFSKPCIVLGKPKYNTRMISLLEKLGLEHNFIPFETECSDIDYNTLLKSFYGTQNYKERLALWIEESYKYLEMYL